MNKGLKIGAVFKTSNALWPKAVKAAAGALSTGIAVAIYTALADVPQPGLGIASLGNNQFLITITNGASTNYTLFWTPVLNDELYPWLVVTNKSDTNFAVYTGTWPYGWFKVLVGIDADGDGIPEWQDAQPGNPAVGILSLTIDSPTDGSSLN